MKKALKTFFEILRSYTVEERVLSLVAIFVFLYSSIKLISFLFSPGALISENLVYTEGYVSNKPVLISPVYADFSQVNRDISALVFAGLMKFNPDSGQFVEDLATLVISPDQKTYTFKLKDNVIFSDGIPVTADDIVFTFNETIQNELFQNPVLKADFEGVIVKKIDEKTVSFEIEKPNSFFVTNFSIGILPKHILGEVPIEELVNNEFNLKPVGAGPFLVLKPLETENNGKQKVELAYNEKFHGYKPKIKMIKINVYQSEEQLLADKDSLNVISRLSISPENPILNNQRFNKISYTLPQYNAVFLNTQSKLLGDKRIRTALGKSVNKEDLISRLNFKEIVNTPILDLKQTDFAIKFDEKAAVEPLVDAGYLYLKDEAGKIKEGEKYRRDKDGNILELTLLARQFESGSVLENETKITVETLIQYWEKAGIKVNSIYLDETEFLAALQNKTYDLVLAGQQSGYNLDAFPFWHSSQADEGGQNLSMYKGLAVDAAIEKIRSTFDAPDKAEKLLKLATVLSEDIPAIFLYRPSYLFFTDGKVKNINLNGIAFTADRFSRIDTWCIGKDCN